MPVRSSLTFEPVPSPQPDSPEFSPIDEMARVLDRPPPVSHEVLRGGTRLTRRWVHGELHDTLKQMSGHVVMTFYGAARETLMGGTLFRLKLNGNGRKVQFSDARLRDGVADNLGKFEITESESLLFGSGFGVGTDIQTGPNGNLYVVSLSHGTVYEIYRERGPGRRGRGRE